MHKFSHIISLFLLCTGLALGGCGKASAPPQGQTGAASDSLKILTIGTADSGGTMYPVGKAISGVVEDSDSTLKLNVSASTGSAGNVRSLEQGSIDLGLVSGDVAFAAVNGSGEFKDAPFKGLKVIAVGAQYDSELVYHNVRKEVAEQGVIYTDMESALTGKYADMVKDHFMKLVTPHDHKFAALHGAVWSGGSFVYVPKGVSVEIPLQSYFRLNAAGAGQFEHTLIIVDEGASLHFIEGCSAPKYNVANLHAGCVELYVGKNAKLRYSTIENWSKNMYNLNTKRAKVEEGGVIEWVSGSFGSHVSYLYPMSVLNGEGARSEFTGITFAGKGQNLDTGCKVVHNAPKTSSYVNTRSISKDGGISTFRSSVVVSAKAKGSKSAVSCQSLMLDDISRSDTIPAMDIRTKDADVGHEAKIGRISDDAVFYMMSRGISEEDARALIVSGFADNVSKELPLEYAVEMNNLIHLEMKGSIG